MNERNNQNVLTSYALLARELAKVPPAHRHMIDERASIFVAGIEAGMKYPLPAPPAPADRAGARIRP